MKREVEEIDLNILPDWQRSSADARLQAWFINTLNNTPETMLWKKAFSNQVVFVRDIIVRVLKKNIESIDVISTHMSKSITLPVYEIVLKEGITLIMRENFYDWKVSVNSKVDLEFPVRLFNHGVNEPIHSCYCEGFDESWIYGVYGKNKKQFTVELSDEYDLYTFIFLLWNQINLEK